MAAGVPQKTIVSKMRYQLKKLVAKHGLTYVKGTASTYPSIAGTIQGHAVTAWYRILRASNGEVAGMLCVSVDGKVEDSFMGPFDRKLAVLGVKV